MGGQFLELFEKNVRIDRDGLFELVCEALRLDTTTSLRHSFICYYLSSIATRRMYGVSSSFSSDLVLC